MNDLSFEADLKETWISENVGEKLKAVVVFNVKITIL